MIPPRLENSLANLPYWLESDKTVSSANSPSSSRKRSWALTNFASSFGLSITLVEAFNTTGRINELLRPCEERMALGTNFHTDQFLGCTRMDHIPASAGDG